MKGKAVLGPVAMVFVLGLSTAAWAQHAGFRAGVAPPQAGFPPPQAPAVATRGTFTAIPSFSIPAPRAPITPIPLVPNFPTVIVPNQAVFPGQPVFPAFPAPFVSPAPVV